MGRTRRKKKHTHQAVQADPTKKGPPKSFVMRRGHVGKMLRRLEQDFRNIMMPHTAQNLKESKRNTLKDFVHVAGPLGVTHFLLVSTTKTAPYLRVAKTPRGPTLTFQINQYSLASDIAAAASKYRAPPTIFQDPPLVVMNNFTGAEEHLKLCTVMFQNMFPPINVQTVRLSQCRRVLLLDYNSESKLIELRHYAVTARPTGVSKSIQKLVQKQDVPNLGGLEDVAEFLDRSGYASESEGEDEASKVTLAHDLGRGNRAANRSAVKLQEIGPRITMRLIKVEEGLCSGKVMFHEFVHKSAEEEAELEAKVKTREELRKQRRAEQDANVRKKQKIEEEKEALKEAKKKRRLDPMHDVRMRKDHPDNRERAQVEDEDDDAEWYRQEVGEEPEEGLMTRGPATRGRGRGRGGSLERPSRTRDGSTKAGNSYGRQRAEGGRKEGVKRKDSRLDYMKSKKKRRTS